MEEIKPKVAVCCIIIKDKKVLCYKRKSKSGGSGKWCFPGGHLEFGEKLAECAVREVMEETGLTVTNLRKAPQLELFFENNLGTPQHYLLHYFVAGYTTGEPALCEPDRFQEWGWFDWDNLPSPRTHGDEALLAEGFNPFRE